MSDTKKNIREKLLMYYSVVVVFGSEGGKKNLISNCARHLHSKTDQIRRYSQTDT